MLVNTNKKLTDTVDSLSDRVAELEEALETERALRKQFEAEANETQELVKAARDYLSWKESPPVGMQLDLYQGIESSFRRSLEQVLRKLEG